MNTSPLQTLQSHIKKCADIETDLAADKNHLALFAEERATLEANLDLTDTSALARVAQLQAIAILAPDRTEIRHAALDAARTELVVASREFIREHLRPRCLQLRQLVEAKVRESLQSHYPEETDLAAAVNVSGLIVELEKISTHAILGGFRTDDCQKKAAQLLAAWTDADAFEKAHLN